MISSRLITETRMYIYLYVCMYVCICGCGSYVYYSSECCSRQSSVVQIAKLQMLQVHIYIYL